MIRHTGGCPTHPGRALRDQLGPGASSINARTSSRIGAVHHSGRTHAATFAGTGPGSASIRHGSLAAPEPAPRPAPPATEGRENGCLATAPRSSQHAPISDPAGLQPRQQTLYINRVIRLPRGGLGRTVLLPQARPACLPRPAPSTGLIHVSGGRDILRPLLRPPLPVSLRRPNPRSNLPRRGIHSGEVDYLRSVPDSIFVHMYERVKTRVVPVDQRTIAIPTTPCTPTPSDHPANRSERLRSSPLGWCTNSWFVAPQVFVFYALIAVIVWSFSVFCPVSPSIMVEAGFGQNVEADVAS